MTIDWEKSRGKTRFTQAMPVGARVLDVGCGNNSPQWFKTVRPDIHYTGLDVGDYQQIGDARQYADDYVICAPEDFAPTIERYRGQMDSVVSNHNLEHCDDPARALKAMAEALKPGAGLYLCFPCEQSVNFPSRGGCLNFFDDYTHKVIPSWPDTLRTLEANGCEIEFRAKRYRPFPLWVKGLFMERESRRRGEVMHDGSTWALYGFESVIWARKTIRQA